MAGILPASLRAGTTTVTTGFGGESNFGTGRETMKLVMPRRRKGQVFTRYRLHKLSKNGKRNGNMISEEARIISNPERVSKFDMSSTVSQFWLSCGFASPSASATCLGPSHRRL